MSTRAIVGVVQNDGCFLGAWQWNDGGDILELLNRKFSDNDSVKKLLSLGMWGSMYGLKQFKSYQNSMENIWKVDFQTYLKERQVKIVEINNVFFTKEVHHTNKPKTYKSVLKALEEDISYIYVYYPNLQKWKKYSYNRMSALKRDGLA